MSVLRDEWLLAVGYPELYRRVRGPSLFLTVLARWLLGSPLKTLLRELPRGVRRPGAYLRLVGILVVERLELVAALLTFLRGIGSLSDRESASTATTFNPHCPPGKANR